MLCFYINRDQDLARREHCHALLTSLGLSPTRFPAVEGASLTPGSWPLLLAWGGFVRPLSSGEIGCVASHASLWLRLAAAGASGLVFEDDIRVTPGVSPEKIISSLLYALALLPDADIIYLGRCLDLCQRLEQAAVTQVGPLYRTASPFCTHAYYVTASGAQKLAAMLPANDAVDGVLIRGIESGLTAYTFHPSLLQQDVEKFGSGLRPGFAAAANSQECRDIVVARANTAPLSRKWILIILAAVGLITMLFALGSAWLLMAAKKWYSG